MSDGAVLERTPRESVAGRSKQLMNPSSGACVGNVTIDGPTVVYWWPRPSSCPVSKHRTRGSRRTGPGSGPPSGMIGAEVRSIT